MQKKKKKKRSEAWQTPLTTMEPNSIFLRDRNKQSKKDNFDYDNIEPQLHDFRDIHTVTQLITAKEHTHKRGCLTHAIWSIKVLTASLQPLTL